MLSKIPSLVVTANIPPIGSFFGSVWFVPFIKLCEMEDSEIALIQEQQELYFGISRPADFENFSERWQYLKDSKGIHCST